MKKTTLALFGLLIILSSCYRMPEEGEVSVLPAVNNPTTTRISPGSMLLPGIEY